MKLPTNPTITPTTRDGTDNETDYHVNLFGCPRARPLIFQNHMDSVRRPFTTQTAIANGMTVDALAWTVRRGKIQRLGKAVYLRGELPPNRSENAASLVVATGGVAIGTFAAFLHGFDVDILEPPYAAVPNRKSRKGVAELSIPADAVTTVRGYRCVNGLHTLITLAAVLDDLQWEQALESALRKNLCTIGEIEKSLSTRRIGNATIRHVLRLRPPGVAPTESLLETLAVQLMRREPLLPAPVRQLEVLDRHQLFVARVDLAFPDHGVFFELDGEQHKDQPLYDANRQTRIVAATGWLIGRFTWTEIVHNPKATIRRMNELFTVAQSIR